jgi:hypothetical protein
MLLFRLVFQLNYLNKVLDLHFSESLYRLTSGRAGKFGQFVYFPVPGVGLIKRLPSSDLYPAPLSSKYPALSVQRFE